MDEKEEYRRIVLEILQDCLAISYPYKNLEFQLVVSEDRDNYLVMIYGTHNSESIHKCIFHLQVKDNNIVIFRDNTKWDIFAKLVAKGLNGDRIIYSDSSQLLYNNALNKKIFSCNFASLPRTRSWVNGFARNKT